MKNALLLSLCLLSFGCKKMIPTTSSLPASSNMSIQKPKFTTIDRVLELEIGLPYDKVVAILGSSPYDVYSMTNDGTSIYVYFYKKIERKEKNSTMYTQDGMTSGDVLLVKDEKVFLVFNGGKLKAVWTDEGLGEKVGSHNLMEENNAFFDILKGEGLIVEEEVTPAETEAPEPPPANNRPQRNRNWR